MFQQSRLMLTSALLLTLLVGFEAHAQIQLVGGPSDFPAQGRAQTAAMKALEPVPVKTLIQAWGKGKINPIVWEAGERYASRYIVVDFVGDTSTVVGFQSALKWLNQLLVDAGVTPLVACMFSDTIVIRRLDQPACAKPL